MTSQIPFEPVTPAALARLEPAEKLAYTVASAQLARGENPPVNTTAALVLAIQRLISEQAGGPGDAIAVRDTYTGWCVAWGGEDANDCAGRLERDDEAGAREMTQWIDGGFVARQTVTRSRWETVPGDEAGR